MSIDPAVLERQQRRTGAAPRPKRVDTVRLVKRAGPRLSDVVCSLGCGRLLAETNTRGFCAHCSSTKWKGTGRKDQRRRWVPMAVKRATFSDGGGI